MSKQVIKITAHLPSIPDWLKLNGSVKIPISLKKAKELAQKLLDVKEEAEIELNFASGQKTELEIKYESTKEE
jgi:hypothetical protein